MSKGAGWKMVILARSSLIVTLLSLLVACGGGGGGGGSDSGGDTGGGASQPSQVSVTQFQTLSSESLTDVIYGVSEYIPDPGKTVNCSSLGTTNSGHSVCVIYGADLYAVEYPKVSVDIDLIVFIPATSEGQLKQWLSDLDDLPVIPVIKNTASLGNFDYATPIGGAQISVRNGGQQPFQTACSILNSSNSIITSFELAAVQTSVFELPSNNGFALAPGLYSVECTFINANHYSVTAPVFSFQVIATNNTAPAIASVTIEGEDSLLKFNGMIRDVNPPLTIVAGGIADKEDDLLGIPLNVDSYIAVGATKPPPVPVSGSSFTYSISNMGGSWVYFGFIVTDSLGASSQFTLGRLIHKNEGPDYSNGLQDVGCLVGGTVNLPTPVFSDPEGDAYTYTYSIGHSGVYDCTTVGDYQYTATATDAYGATGQSPSFTISVSATNRPPTISAGGFTNATCYFAHNYFCYMTINLPYCSDPDGNLATSPVVYDGYGTNGSYASGGAVTDSFSTGYTTISAHCVDDQGLTSETLNARILGCVQDPVSGLCL